MSFERAIRLAAQIVEAAGVAVILCGVFAVALATTASAWRAREWGEWYRRVRQRMGRVVLLGLELLLGADIIRTVAERPTLSGVVVLGVIVLIRTFLSFTIELELDGRWPWQRRAGDGREGKGRGQ